MFAGTPAMALTIIILIFGTCEESFVNGNKLDGARITRRHHQYRHLVRSSNMIQLIWSPYLATKADELSALCQNNSENIRDNKVLDRFGINIGSRIIPQMNDRGSISIIDSWGSQRSSYTYPAECSNNKCDQWIQMIWADTHELGCGSKLCGNEEILICLYNEKANLSGIAPYKEGPECSECRDGFQKCRDKFCIAENPEEHAAAELVTLAPDPAILEKKSVDTLGEEETVLRRADTFRDRTTSLAEIGSPQLSLYCILSTFLFFNVFNL